jgi:hypothetical protein
MLLTTITRPPFTYTTFSFFLCNLILEKLFFLLFKVEDIKIFLALSFFVSFVASVHVVVDVGVIVVASVVVVVVAIVIVVTGVAIPTVVIIVVVIGVVDVAIATVIITGVAILATPTIVVVIGVIVAIVATNVIVVTVVVVVVIAIVDDVAIELCKTQIRNYYKAVEDATKSIAKKERLEEKKFLFFYAHHRYRACGLLCKLLHTIVTKLVDEKIALQHCWRSWYPL